jgi:glucokinase
LAQAVADGVELNPELIWKLAKTGDIASLELIDTVARWLGIGITTLLHTLDPAIILLGGAMTFGGESDPIGGRFLERIRAEVRERAFPLLAERTPIRFATLGGDAGYVGTAGMARAEHLRLHPSNA